MTDKSEIARLVERVINDDAHFPTDYRRLANKITDALDRLANPPEGACIMGDDCGNLPTPIDAGPNAHDAALGLVAGKRVAGVAPSTPVSTAAAGLYKTGGSYKVGDVERVARDHVRAFKEQSHLGGLMARDERLLTDLFQQAVLAALPTVGEGEVRAIAQAVLSADAWLDRWAVHVGRCEGGPRCTCGLTAIRNETLLATPDARAALGQKGESHD